MIFCQRIIHEKSLIDSSYKNKYISSRNITRNCDVIKPSENLYNKILKALGTLILELDNLLSNTGITNNYESLYLLYVYEEEVREDDKEYKSLQDTYIKNASLFK